MSAKNYQLKPVYFVFFSMLFSVSSLWAQKVNYYLNYSESGESGQELCAYIQQSAYTTDKEVEDAVDQILAPIGFPRNFVLVSCPKIKGARAATSEDGFRYIVYDLEFITSINSADGTDWAAMQILAHELAHHFLGHTLRPSNNLVEQRKNELEADQWSGFILYKLGATLKDAQSAVREKAREGDDTYWTHPNKTKRLASLEKGYNNSKKLNTPENSDNKPSAEAYFNKGNQLFAKNDFNGALAAYNNAVDANPKSAQIFFNRGHVRKKLGDNQGAANDFSEAIKLKQDFGEAYNYRGQMMYKLEQYNNCLSDMNMALQFLTKSDPLVLYYRGLSYKHLGDYNAALNDLSNAIALQKDANFYLNRSVVYTKLGKFQAALNDCNESLVLDSSLMLNYYNRGMNKYLLQDFAGAAADLEIWIEHKPDDEQAMTSLGQVYAYGKMTEKALALYTKMIEKNMNAAETHFLRGKVYKSNYQNDLALADFNQAIARGYQKPEVYLARANVFYTKNENDAGIADINRAFELGLTSGDAYYLRGLMHQRQGSDAEACSDFESACQRGSQQACNDKTNFCP